METIRSDLDCRNPESEKGITAMGEKQEYLTREGQAKLEAELEELTTLGRREVAERISAAKELGDISESGEYEDAKKSQAILEGRIREIKSILSRAEIIENDHQSHTNRFVRMGSVVTVQFQLDGEEEETETWSIVGSTEAAPSEGRISNESPIGAALLGKKAGDKANVQTPSGIMRITILEIR
jgi:transcription elongation factor GreA